MERLLERLSLADEVSKYGAIVDNPGNEEWPFKAECTFTWSYKECGERKSLTETITVLLSRSKKTFMLDHERWLRAGDLVDFFKFANCSPYNLHKEDRESLARWMAIERRINVWED